jgi:hypothetical protein
VITLDTVAGDTPARVATSRMVGGRWVLTEERGDLPVIDRKSLNQKDFSPYDGDGRRWCRRGIDVHHPLGASALADGSE